MSPGEVIWGKEGSCRVNWSHTLGPVGSSEVGYGWGTWTQVSSSEVLRGPVGSGGVRLSS